jgi:uncharacterized protein
MIIFIKRGTKMAIYAISDLHLALSVDKPMDVFGNRWSGYMEKIEKNWNALVSNDDYVLIPGDISWATYLEQSLEDFKYIDALPGKKIITKGNHDYWWTTMNKLESFIRNNHFSTISFMHNNSFKVGRIVLCGTRGWKCPGDDDFSQEDRKIYERELKRLELSIKSALQNDGDELVVAMHYPPFNSDRKPSDFVEIMHKYDIKNCVYGHLHGDGFKNAVEGMIDGIDFHLVSADYLSFTPLKLEV